MRIGDRLTRGEIYRFLRSRRLAVEASISEKGTPEAAVVGVAVAESLELIFDSIDSSRKIQNLRINPRIAFVFWDGEVTVQYEGIADEPKGAELKRLKKIYFEAFPDGPGREALPGITYVRTRPKWIRLSDFRTSPPSVIELKERDFR